MWSASFLLVVAAVFLAMAIIYGGRWSATYYFSYANELYALKLSINNSLANPIRLYDLRHFLTLCNDPQSGVAYAYYVQGAGQPSAVCAYAGSQFAFYRFAAIVERCFIATDYRGQRSFVAQVRVYTDPLILVDIGFQQDARPIPAVGWNYNSTYTVYYVPTNPFYPFTVVDYPIKAVVTCPVVS